jgi:hypothetical protein
VAIIEEEVVYQRRENA